MKHKEKKRKKNPEALQAVLADNRSLDVLDYDLEALNQYFSEYLEGVGDLIKAVHADGYALGCFDKILENDYGLLEKMLELQKVRHEKYYRLKEQKIKDRIRIHEENIRRNEEEMRLITQTFGEIGKED